MRSKIIVAALCTAGALAGHAEAAAPAVARPAGTVLIPRSSVVRSQDRGLRAHTMFEVFMPKSSASQNNKAPYGFFETPASLACVYRLVPQQNGCNPQRVTALASGGSKVIAIVDAYDNPKAASDLAVFSKVFGLPAITPANFQVVYAAGKLPPQDFTGGWELEESLDVQMAHALAPGARIILVEAASDSFADLLSAEQVASSLVWAAGGGEVSNSWGGEEFEGEETNKAFFSTPGVVYFASSGDYFDVEFPSVLPNVVAAGGASIDRDADGNFLHQSTWFNANTNPPSGGGGGQSLLINRPAYQNVIKTIIGEDRSTPDLSFDSNPNTGVWVYDTIPYLIGINASGDYDFIVPKWIVLGGTSVASPALAAIANNAGHFYGSSDIELDNIYEAMSSRAAFRDVVIGTCPAEDNYRKYMKGWDFCTGVGTPVGRLSK